MYGHVSRFKKVDVGVYGYVDTKIRYPVRWVYYVYCGIDFYVC